MENHSAEPGTGEGVTKWRHVWLLWFLAIAAGLTAGVLASWYLFDSRPPVSLSLEARQQAGELVIRWNPRSTAAAHDERAIVTLSGEDGSVQLVCDRACLARGSISYPWRPSTVDIGMRLTGAAGQSIEERTRFVAPPLPDEPGR